MAKLQDRLVKKGTPSGVAKLASTDNLRRSPRKAVQSAKSLGSDILAAPSRIMKKAAPKKKSMATTATSSTTKAAKPTTTRAGSTSSPMAKAPTSPGPESITTASPKRGRPRKNATPQPAILKGPTNGRVTKRKSVTEKKPATKPTVAAAKAKENWTDSPKKKKSPAKRPSKVPAVGSKAVKKLLETQAEVPSDNARARLASLGGIRKSIEVPALRSRSRSPSKSPSRSASKSPPRRRSTSAKPAMADMASQDALADRDELLQDTDRVVVQVPPSRATRSPSRMGSVQSVRGRSKSPAKKRVTREPKNALTREPARSPSLVCSNTGLRVAKTRSSRSPVKGQTANAESSRQASPVHPIASLEKCRQSRTQSKSPTRKASQVNSSSDHSPGQTALIERFIAKNEYGQVLRRIEAQAYKGTKDGKGVGGRDAAVSKADEKRARERGVHRAELEMDLRSISNSKTLKVREETHDGAACFGSPQRRRPGSRASLSKGKEISAGDEYRPDTNVAEEEDEENEPVISPVRRSASPRKLSRSVPSVERMTSPRKSASPIRNTVAVQSTVSRQRSPAKDNNQPIGEGHPSAPNRGTIRSITNPEFIPGTREKNPFFETMPGPEVWHRRMPRFFPFGETPYIQREMSKQISADLARGAAEAADTASASTGLLDRMTSAVKSGVNMFGQSLWPASPPRERPHRWDLPEVTDAEVGEVLKEIKAKHHDASTVAIGRRRRGSGARVSSPPKRARQRSHDHLMSSAL